MSVLRVTPRAQLDLSSIHSYVAADDANAALRLIDDLHTTMTKLADHPQMGTRRDDLRERLRLFSLGNYVICFRPLANGIEVARVLHGARDIQQVFRRRGKH